jgi:hypothetical protein
MDCHHKHPSGCEWPAWRELLVQVRKDSDYVLLEPAHDLDHGQPTCKSYFRARGLHISNQILLAMQVANKANEIRIEIFFEQVVINVGHDKVKLVCTTPNPDEIGPSGIIQECKQTDVPSCHVPRCISRNAD